MKHFTKEHRQKLREAHLGKKLTEEHRKSIAISLKKSWGDGTRKRISAKQICKYCGKIYYHPPSMANRGKNTYCSDKCRRNGMSNYFLGENNPDWKGDNVSYGALHRYIREYKPKPEFCEICGISCKERKFDLANKKHDYKRNVDDYMWLCKSCHSKYDKNWLKIAKNSKGQFTRPLVY